MSLSCLQIDYENFLEHSAKATIQVLYDVSLFDRLDKKDEIFKINITYYK